MKILPGQRLVLASVVMATVSLGLLFEFSWWPLLLLLFAGLVGVTIQDLRRLKPASQKVTASLHLPKSCGRGDSMNVELVVQNPGTLPLEIKVRLLLPEQGSPVEKQIKLLVPPGDKVVTSFAIGAKTRGRYRFGDIYIRIATPWQLLETEIAIANEQTVRVLPDVDAVKEYLVSRRADPLSAPHVRTARLRGIGCEFESLREYEQGDDIRRIDWRATARQQKLILRNYEIEPYRDVLIVVDNGRLMGAEIGDATKLDLAIDAALMISGVVLDSGDRCGVMVFGSEIVSYLKPRPTIRQLTTIVDTLYDVHPVIEESDFKRAFAHLKQRLTKRSLVIVLSTLTEVDPGKSMLTSLLTMGRQHLVVLAALRTPELDAVIDAPVKQDVDTFKKAVVYRLYDAQNDVLKRLGQGGVHTLSVAPEELKMPVVNKYIELRERNLL